LKQMSVLHRNKDRAILVSQHNDFVVPAPSQGRPADCLLHLLLWWI
jgi:hypothetical protein